jgi:hypothetical protein
MERGMMRMQPVKLAARRQRLACVYLASFQERAQHSISQLDKEVRFQPLLCVSLAPQVYKGYLWENKSKS